MPPGLLTLPDELCIRCLRFLSFQERHRAVPLVCRRLKRLVLSPDLLGSVTAEVHKNSRQSVLARLQALCGWLVLRAARHVTRLDLTVMTVPTDDHWEAFSLITAMVAACGGLQELLLRPNMDVCCSSWLLAAQQLRHLYINSEESSVVVTAPLHQLTQLERLQIRGDGLHIEVSARLPPSITWLHLEYHERDRLPKQLSALTRLQALSLNSSAYSAAGQSLLLRLPSLRRLMLARFHHLPACLSQLTRLEALGLEALLPEDMNALRAALPHLAGSLTCLACSEVQVQPPPELACLTRLQSFCWYPESGACLEKYGEALPGGAWLASLRWLAAPVETVSRSLAALDTASRLEHLSVWAYSSTTQASQHMAAALQWAARHPPLRSLDVLAEDGLLATLFVTAVSTLQRRPGLLLTRGQQEFDGDCLLDMCVGPGAWNGWKAPEHGPA